jgi:nucleoside-diphosphate-sugar epimerase
MVALHLPLSNQKARTELGWQPSFPSIREGLIRTLPQSGVSVLR